MKHKMICHSNNYKIQKLKCKEAKEYIRKNHYSHGCHNGASPCYGLFDNNKLIGVLMFATPCSENVRASIFGKEYKNWVTELHRLHIMDVTPKNTESWFISRCLKKLKEEKPIIRAVISFSDSTENHSGIVYRATNAIFYGMSSKATFYKDETGRLRHPRQCGVNISLEKAKELNWKPMKRFSKYRYLWLLPEDKREKRKLIRMLKIEKKAYP
jgi:hypothetical protein